MPNRITAATETNGTAEALEIEARVPAVLTLLQKTTRNDPLLAAAVCGQSLVTLRHIASVDVETLLVAIREQELLKGQAASKGDSASA